MNRLTCGLGHICVWNFKFIFTSFNSQMHLGAGGNLDVAFQHIHVEFLCGKVFFSSKYTVALHQPRSDNICCYKSVCFILNRIDTYGFNFG